MFSFNYLVDILYYILSSPFMEYIKSIFKDLDPLQRNLHYKVQTLLQMM